LPATGLQMRDLSVRGRYSLSFSRSVFDSVRSALTVADATFRSGWLRLRPPRERSKFCLRETCGDLAENRACPAMKRSVTRTSLLGSLQGDISGSCRNDFQGEVGGQGETRTRFQRLRTARIGVDQKKETMPRKSRSQ